MEEWYCFKCKELMQKKNIMMSYMDISRFQPGLKCPKCGAAYITEETIVEIIMPGEETIEAKF